MQILIEKQREISRENLKKFVGKEIKVLIEKKEDEYFVGRTEFDAPEIDGLVYIKNKNLKIGNFYKIKITDSSFYDLSSFCKVGPRKEGSLNEDGV